MKFRPSFIYPALYYYHTLSLKRKFTNEIMGIPEIEIEIGSCREDLDKYIPQGINQNRLEMRMNFQSHCCNK